MTSEDNGNGRKYINGRLISNIMLAILTALIAILGTITLEFKRDLMAKMDRVVLTFQEEKRNLIVKLDSICDKVGETSKKLEKHETLLRLPHKDREKIMGGGAGH